MDADTTLQEMAQKQGWNDRSQLALCLCFIDNHGQIEEFKEYLEKVAAYENERDG